MEVNIKMFNWDKEKIDYVENFITQEESDLVVSYFESVRKKPEYLEKIKEAGVPRVHFPFMGIKDEKIKQLIIDLDKRIYSYLIGTYAPKHNLRVHSLTWKRDLEIVRWTHMGLQPHRDGHDDVPDTDNVFSKGLPISSLIYFTDNFDGGSLSFDDFGLKIKPAALSFVSFPSFYLHEVTEITSFDDFGRYTLPLFYGFEVSEFNNDFFMKEKIEQYEFGPHSFDEIVLDDIGSYYRDLEKKNSQ
jgi:hypothetical protein